MPMPALAKAFCGGKLAKGKLADGTNHDENKE
jgi:hypothetical protein